MTPTSEALTAPLAINCLISKRSGLDKRLALVPLRSSTCNRGTELLPEAALVAERRSSSAISSEVLIRR